MRTLLIAVLIISCVACADTGNTATTHDIYASRFIYDAAAKPVIVSGGNFVYDPAAPVLRASSFMVENNQ